MGEVFESLGVYICGTFVFTRMDTLQVSRGPFYENVIRLARR